MTTYTITESQRQQLQAYLQTQCGLRCNAEYNPCEAQELDTMLRSLTPNSGEPFGIWYPADDADECEFFLHSKSGEVSCPDCIPLFTHPAPSTKPAEPDMFWNADDSEMMHQSIEEFLNDEICNGSLEVGSVYTILQAKFLPNVIIKITSIDDNESEAEYEVVTAAQHAAPGEPAHCEWQKWQTACAQGD